MHMPTKATLAYALQLGDIFSNTSSDAPTRAGMQIFGNISGCLPVMVPVTRESNADAIAL
jgi:hypothetical protein